MYNFFESLKKYFELTPKEIIIKDWEEIKYLNQIGPDVSDYYNYIKDNIKTQ